MVYLAWSVAAAVWHSSLSLAHSPAWFVIMILYDTELCWLVGRCKIIEAENEELQTQILAMGNKQHATHASEQELNVCKEVLRKKDESDTAALW